MANYNSNDRNKGYFDQYVNFDQFLMQHNMNSWSPMHGQQQPSDYGFLAQSPTLYNSNSPYNSNGSPNEVFHQSASGGFHMPNWQQSSNLTATASEFVPQQVSSNPSSSSTLFATASEFFPRYQQGFDRPARANPSNETKQANTISCDKDNKDSVAPKVTDDSASKTDSVIEALSNTHISQGNRSESRPLNSSGGAIKKVRSQDYRNDSRDRHSNGKLLQIDNYAIHKHSVTI